MGFLKDLKVKLGLDNSKFKQGVKEAEGSTNKLGSSIKKIGGLIAGAFAVGKIVSFFKESFRLYGIQEKAERDLGNAIANNGKQVETTLEDYKRFASGMQRITTIGDETTLQLLKLAEVMQSKAPKEAAKSAIALSKAFGIDLQSALKMVILAENNEYTMLQRYIPALRTVNTDLEKREILEKAVAGGMKIATDETKTQTGKLQQLSNAWGDLQERIGSIVSRYPQTLTFLEGLIEKIEVLGMTDGEKAARHLMQTIDKEGKTAEERVELINTAYANTKKNIEELNKIWKQPGLFTNSNLNINDFNEQWEKAGTLAKKANETTKTKLDSEQAILDALAYELDFREKSANLDKEQVLLAAKKTEEAKRLAEEAKRIAAEEAKIVELRKEIATEVTIKRPKETVSVKVSLEPEYENLALGLDTVKIATSLPKIPIDIEISSMSRQVLEGLNPMTEAEERTAEFVANMGAYAEDFKNSAVAGFSDGMQLMADSLFAGEDLDAGAMVAALLTPLADMAIRTGEIAIGIGIGIEAIKTSLATLGGIGAIAAGVALIAIGATAKSLLKSASKGGGSGGTSSRNSGSGLQAQPVTGGVNMIQGGESSSMSNSGGGSLADQLGDVKFMINGDNLVGIFDRNNNRRKKY